MNSSEEEELALLGFALLGFALIMNDDGKEKKKREHQF